MERAAHRAHGRRWRCRFQAHDDTIGISGRSTGRSSCRITRVDLSPQFIHFPGNSCVKNGETPIRDLSSCTPMAAKEIAFEEPAYAISVPAG
jgi:hypothetical protein